MGDSVTGELPEGIKQMLKSASRAAVLAAAAPGSTGPQRVEQITGYAQGSISRWCGEAHKDLMPLDVACLLEFTTQAPVFARAFAALTGHRLVPVEPDAKDVDEVQHLVRIATTGAGLTQAIGDAIADGRLTPREREALRQHLRKHHDVLADFERELADIDLPGER